MKKEIGVIVIAVFLIFITIHLFTNTFKKCPELCNDLNKCTKDYCLEQTNFECVYDPIPSCCGNQICEENETADNCSADCPFCNDSDPCTEDYYSYSVKKCLTKPVIPCCGNGACEVIESLQTCFQDCPLDGSIEIKTSHISNPTFYSDNGQRVFYHIRNCLPKPIKLLELMSYYNGKQGKRITKEMLEESQDSLEISLYKIPTDSCYNPLIYLLKTSIVKNQSETYASRIYFKFEYGEETYEILSNEKMAKVRSSQNFSNKDLAIYNITNSNINKL